MEFTEPTISREETRENNIPNMEEKTEQNTSAVSFLEHEIDDIYSSMESKFSSLWSKASSSLEGSQIIFPRSGTGSEGTTKQEEEARSTKNDFGREGPDQKFDLTSISESANKALDELDSKLEIVEQKAGFFVNSLTSFFTSGPSTQSSSTAEGKARETSSPPIIPTDAYGSTRYDMELFKLHTTNKIYLDHEPSENLQEFVVDDKTQEITDLLQKYQETLGKLMKNLVPTQLSYEKFWSIYFEQELKLKAAEKARKELLSKGTSGDSRREKDLSHEPGLKYKDSPQDSVAEKETKKLDDPRKSEFQEEEEEEEDFSWDDDEEIDNSVP